ncbi:MAG: type I 3-dehydroquinate dehydratase [Bacteroidales bacterium]|nr:type I 3-dehydroquinate dehydratase [Bacteroidales bacterium]
MICASVAHISGLDEAIKSGAGLIELRLDLIKESPSRLFPLMPKNMETIVTCRPGVYSDPERTGLLQAGMKLGADYVDIELESDRGAMEQLIGTAGTTGTRVIISHHDFIRTADREDLESLMKACYEKGAEIAKIATWVNAPEDIRKLLSLYDFPGKKVILGMGPLGRITRVVAPYLGAVFTFASTTEADETAPGQLSIKQLNELYKVIDNS